MKMHVSDPASLVNVLYAKGFPLQRRRSPESPAAFSLHNLAALDTQSRPPFQILNRTKIASLSPTPGRVYSLRPSNTVRQQPRDIKRQSSLNLGKREIAVVMPGYCIPTARRAPRCYLTSLTIKNAKYRNILIIILRYHSRAQIRTRQHALFNSKHTNPLAREIKCKK
jgi:hypothetical protein